jgi:hypothetical protein
MRHILDPETGYHINLYSDRVNELSNRYNEKQLIYSKITPIMLNRETIFNNDVLYTIMLHLKLNDIKSLSMTDKHAQKLCYSKVLWEQLMKRDKLYIENLYTKNIDFTMYSYRKLLIAQEKVENLPICRYNYFATLKYDKLDMRKFLFCDYLNKIEKSEKFTYNLDTATFHKTISNTFIPFSNRSLATKHLTRQEMDQVLLLLYYHYPDIKISAS